MFLFLFVVAEKDITASDFSVKISGVPKDATALELATHFSQFGELYRSKDLQPNLFDNAFDQTGVSLVRNDAAFIKATFDLIECKAHISELAVDDAEDMKKKIKLDLQLEQFQGTYDALRAQDYHCAGTAFVSYMYQDGRNACLAGTKHGTFSKRIDHGVGSTFQCEQKMTNKYKHNVLLTAEIAPDPNDLLWKNLQNSQCNILTRQCIIGTVSFFYLMLLGMVMAYFAAHSREYSKHGLISLGLLGILGNVLCCVTSIVLLMPILSTYEGVYQRSTLEIITFLKVGFFQTMGVVIGTLYVFSLDEPAADGRAFSNAQLGAVGSGLPTTNCSIRRFQNTTLGAGNVTLLDADSCFAYTLHLFGSGMGPYLIGTLIADLALINMIDLLCPPWWVETGLAHLKKYQIDVNKIYEGVDYKPFLRYQILLKFLMTALFLSHIDHPRIMYFWVAVCFWQSLEIDRYCYVLRYRTPPYFDSSMINVVIVYALPIGLLIHTAMHLFFFGLDWNWDEHKTTFRLTVALRQGFIPVVTVVFFVLVGLFLVVWFLPLKFWLFGTDKWAEDEHSKQGGGVSSKSRPHLSRSASKALMRHKQEQQEGDDGTISDAEDTRVAGQLADLSFSDALQVHADNVAGGVGSGDRTNDNIISHLLYIEVRKYIPDPIRREFGVLKLN